MPEIRTRLPSSLAPGARTFEAQLDDGSWLHISERRTKDGGYVSVGTDITQIKKHEQKLVDNDIRLTANVIDLKRSQSELERQAQLLAELAQKYAEEKNRAEEANQTKSKFLANMSHELRTPLNAIVGFGEMLHQQVLGPLGVARYGEYARDICESGQKLLALVSRMLDLADMEKGKLDIARAPFSVAAVLQQSIAVTRALANAAGVELEVRGEAAPWPDLTGDGEKLREALTCIFQNGVKFTPAGGRLEISAERSGGEILIRVADSGVGMSPEDIAVVTQPFHRLRSALDGLHQGAGLGLPFAKAIAELHGGRLDISSNPGIGTVVEVRLPLEHQTLEKAA
jgi:two-component system cell cycle sensor histidine kinase PleC